MNNNVKKIGKDTYEISFVIKGELSKIIVTKTGIIEIEDKETEKSYIDELGLAPFIRYSETRWKAPTPSVVYYENGKTEIWSSDTDQQTQQ